MVGVNGAVAGEGLCWTGRRGNVGKSLKSSRYIGAAGSTRSLLQQPRNNHLSYVHDITIPVTVPDIDQ